ncbi:hypothetical protein ABHV46_10985 [Asaia sp. BMEF1]|uniref:hypothetical protein n=1 Tax=Asaia sp. BMEF1 TaxID=3155932 RepID=UPI003F664640
MTPRLTAQQRIEQSDAAIAFLSNPAFDLHLLPLRKQLIADHERRIASDKKRLEPEDDGISIPKMKGTPA